MSAKNSSYLQLPVDDYSVTPDDITRAKQERARGMVTPQHIALGKSAQEISPNKIKSARVQRIAERLLAVATDQQHALQKGVKRRMLVGLAAPQIGESSRIIVIDTKITAARKVPGKLECFINPELVWRSRETAEGREGCFSAGPVWGLVRRPVAVKIRAFTLEGKRVERIFEGFTARIACHEIDHLDGIRFPERIKTDRKRHWVHAEEIDKYPKHVKHWPRLCSLVRWNELKNSKTTD
jgi:peptide deformylase